MGAFAVWAIAPVQANAAIRLDSSAKDDHRDHAIKCGQSGDQHVDKGKPRQILVFEQTLETAVLSLDPGDQGSLCNRGFNSKVSG